MLTTHSLVQSTAAYLFPVLLMLIAWYSVAASFRAFVEFLYRLRQKRKVGRNIKELSRPLSQKGGHTVSDTMHHYLGGLQSALEESLLIGNKATGSRIAFVFLESMLFTTLAVASFYTAGPLLNRLNEIWWIHLLVPFFFLCFILRARRILLLIPLTVLALLSWEVVSFIASFEKTLEATTLMATVDVTKRTVDPKNPNEPAKVTMQIKYRTGKQIDLTLPAHRKLFFEGRVFRVSTEVLLFGGKNLATIDRVFSDEMKPKNAFILVKKESTPPLYQWKDGGLQSYLLPQKKLFRWLWREFHMLRKKQYIGSRNPVQLKLLEAAICPPPIVPGKRFEIRLRNVGGLECHAIKHQAAKVIKKALVPRAKPRTPTTKKPTVRVPPQSTVPDKK